MPQGISKTRDGSTDIQSTAHSARPCNILASMARRQKQDTSNSEASSSEHSPSPTPTSSSKPPRSQQADLVDPEQDALVGKTSLDDRFNEEQLRRLVLKKDEYRCAGKKARKELALRMGETFVTEMLKSGVKISESERAALLEVRRYCPCPCYRNTEPFISCLTECKDLVCPTRTVEEGADRVDGPLEWPPGILQKREGPGKADAEAHV